jgi:hypothetical protein
MIGKDPLMHAAPCFGCGEGAIHVADNDWSGHVAKYAGKKREAPRLPWTPLERSLADRQKLLLLGSLAALALRRSLLGDGLLG